MNDKNIQKQKLPLALKLNLNKNKETVDSSFSTAGKLENAPIYNNSITNYFEKTEQNNGPTVYDEDNNKYTVDVQGNVITKDISLFTIDLTKFEKEEIENVDNVVSYDNGWKLINNGAIYTLTNDTDSYNITVDNVIDARVRVVKGLPTYCIIYNNKDGNHCVKAGYVKNGTLQSLAAAKEVVYYYWKGTAVANLTTSSNIKISTINADYTDLQLIENSRLANATPLIQISNPYGDYIAFSILYKKGLIHNDEFAFATFYVNTANNNWYKDESGSSTITYDFDEKQVVKIKITLKIYYSMAFEGPIHYFDYIDGSTKVWEIIPAGSFIEGAAAVTMVKDGTEAVLDEPATIKMNYTWGGFTNSHFLNKNNRANLPVKYGRRRVTSYNQDTYEILDYQTLSGDNKTNWGANVVYDYNQIYGDIRAIAIPAGSEVFHFNKTNMVLEDTQIAIFSPAGTDSNYTESAIKKNGTDFENLHTVGFLYGRNHTRPKITSVTVTYRGTTETIDIPADQQDKSTFYCFDEYNNKACEWDGRQPAGYDREFWFSNNEYYIKNGNLSENYKYNFYNGNNEFELTYAYGEGTAWKDNMPLSRMYYYSQNSDYGFHTVVARLLLSESVETQANWCYNRKWLDYTGEEYKVCLPVKIMYEQIFRKVVSQGSQYAFEPDAITHNRSVRKLYNINKTLITKEMEVNSEDNYPAVIPGTQTQMPPPLEPKYIMDDGSLYYSGYHSFNSSIAQTDCFGYKGHTSNMSIENNNLKLTWVIDNFLLINSGNENKYYKGDTRYINQGIYSVTNAWSNPTTPYSDSSPTNGPDWDSNDKWYFNYYDNNLNRMVSNPGVISEDSYIKYGGAMYEIPAYYHSMGASVSMGNWNLLYNEAVGGLTLSGISYSPNSASMRGTLVTPWYSLNDNAYISYEGDKIYFKDRNNKWNKVSLVLGYDVKIMFNRYIIFNTTSFWNAYDMKTKQKLHYADDWNNRISLGISSVQDNAAAIETNNNLTILLASGIGEQYTMEEVKDLPSMIFNPVAKKYWNGDSTFFTYKNGGDPNINVYNTSTSSTIPTYLYSIKNGKKITDNNLNNVYFPVSSSGYMYVNPDMFMKVLRSYKNTDMFLEEDTAYAVNYYNNNPVMIYNFTSEQRGLEGLFVLQTMTYGIINNYIYSLTYSNNLITSSEPVCSVEGMKFVGFLPNAAYFYSKKNRTLYEFTGDANLTILTECTEIEDILNTYYDTATKTIYWLTPKGFVVYSGDYCYTIPTENVDTFYTTNTDILIKYKDYSTKFLRFEPAEDYTKLPYKILTSPYGADNNTISKLSNMYIQTVNDFVEKEDNVKITSYSYTDTEVKSSNKTFERKPVIPYIPEYDCGTGTAFEIEGTIPIKGIVIDVNPIGATQKVNINTGVIR